MALSGDYPLVPGIRLDTTVYVDNFGQISTEPTMSCINGVIQVIDGKTKDILHLIGHPIRSVEHLITDGIFRSTEEVNQTIKELPQRGPASYLLQENDLLFGAIIDSKGETRIAGLVRHVIPEHHNDGYQKALKIAKDNTWDFCHPRDLDLSASISGGAIFGIIGIGGMFFLQTNVCDANELPDLSLILQSGYFIIEDSKLIWIRLKTCQRIGEIESNVSHLERGECLVSSRGGCIRGLDGFELYGSGSAIVDFERLKEFVISMQYIGFQPSDQNEEQDIVELKSAVEGSCLSDGPNAEERIAAENESEDEDNDAFSDTFSDAFRPSSRVIEDYETFNAYRDCYGDYEDYDY
jgi:hypothetical protein